ncbi:metallophosphoesterase [Telmatospirillum sp. J64-1]|uniref:metallophosphoesterase n=1 Tax=Telmatospirillum sp. J64-1 TaxID=2502183 RepID=UPI0021064704|nr:metallophosphoesterase [Telmatospirillum sp. J64-1]
MSCVPDGSIVYAIGDVHGRADLLDSLLALIEDDAEQASASRRLVVFLGDYIDRGAHSREVLDRLVAGPAPGFEWKTLRGNHEDFLLRFLQGQAVGPTWLINGGLETLGSYLGETPEMPATLGETEALRLALEAALPPEHKAFLEGLAVSHQEGDYFFAHAGVRPGIPLERQNPADLMWIRGDFLESKADFGKVVVHGHTIVPRPETRTNRIGIDTGAYASGRLTALALEGERQRFLQT